MQIYPATLPFSLQVMLKTDMGARLRQANP
jgi:hypothetical protein